MAALSALRFACGAGAAAKVIAVNVEHTPARR
jgi:hypothetical protein